MSTAPCYNCPDRVVGCHSTCEKYLAYAEERKKILQKRQREIDERGDVIRSMQRKKYRRR